MGRSETDRLAVRTLIVPLTGTSLNAVAALHPRRRGRPLGGRSGHFSSTGDGS